MAPVRYDTIAPNIAHVDADGSTIHVTWRCAVSGREVGRSTAAMSADTSTANRVQASVKRSIAQEVIYGAARLVAGLIGGSAGRVVSVLPTPRLTTSIRGSRQEWTTPSRAGAPPSSRHSRW